MKKELPKNYNASDFEDVIYKKWNDAGAFNPDNLKSENKGNYSIIMPPPNVTGILHIGHSAMLALEDIMIRYNRMQGKKSLWIPGTDHAAIATQTKVEKIVKEEGESRHSLGREKFLERVSQFAQDSHDTIVDQVKKMGSSCDWSREAYTLDDIRTKAVRSVFKLMYDDGLIYRGDRVVNWCPRCHSTLADDEVEYKAQKAKLYTFKYSPDFPFAIATTRPETKLGDTAVAVNPKDERYKEYIGKTYRVNFLGVDLTLKIIADRNIEMDFGTGALGVTPAHSMVDWQMKDEHNLKVVKVIDEDGKIKDSFGEYSGKDLFHARKEIVAKLKEQGLMIKEEEIDNNLSICYRCDTPVEPLPSLQWFLDVNKPLKKFKGKTIKEVCIEVVREGFMGDKTKKIDIYPERFEKTYFNWMENLNDWCISRQIWFGHQIPVWYRQKINATEIMFMRHGKTEWNSKSIMQGNTNTDLTDVGVKQAESKIKILKDFDPDFIISSPLKRAMDTAKIMADGNFEIKTDKRLEERYYADVQGLKFSDIKEQYPEFESFQINGLPYLIDVPEGGETYEDVFKRVKEFLIETIKNNPGKKIMVMSHGDPLDMVDAILAGKPWREGVGEWHDNTRMRKDSLGISNEEIVAGDDEVYVGTEEPDGEGWKQDSDTLDTWFSSGLWTFTTLANSPDDILVKNGKIVVDSKDFKNFHPTNVLETGYDILFFWVARMILMTTYAVEDIPFKDVYLHGLVLDGKGKKMSKSKGNSINPLDMIKLYGTDAVRLALVVGSSPGQDIKVSEEKIAGYRNMVNKLWNISRYVISNFDFKISNDISISKSELSISDKWLLQTFRKLIIDVNNDIEGYRFSQAGESLREFMWNDLADWYLEISKFEENNTKQNIFNLITRDLLKLWHPFIPFVTEVIWESINNEMLITNDWPKVDCYDEILGNIGNTEADNFENYVRSVVVGIRNARAENKVEPNKKIKAVIFAGKQVDLIKSQVALIKSLRTGIESLEIYETGKKPKNAILVTVGEIEIYLLGAVDPEKEKKRIEKEIENLEKQITGAQNKLNNEEFVSKAPGKVVEIQKDNVKKWKGELSKLKEQQEHL